MYKKITSSLKSVNISLYLALLVMGLCPTIYTTVRTFFLGQFPGEYAYSIAGQLSWVNLFYEVINESIILPLYFFMGQAFNDKKEFSNRIRTGLIVSCGAYCLISVLTIVFIDPLLNFMMVSPDLLSASISYIRLECIANVFGILYSFVCVALISTGNSLSVYILTLSKLVLSLLLDTFMISTLPFSLKLGVNGIGLSNIISNILLLVTSIWLIDKQGFHILAREKLSFCWIRALAKVGSVSGLESLVRNLAYMFMVSRMVNMVGEQGTYWVANNFIWGWLLLPVLQLGELIKQETSENKASIKTNTPAYFFITTLICFLWIATIPLYKPFMLNILGFQDVNKLFRLVLILLIFYIFYAYQNIFDMTFYGRGKTGYMLFESVVTNTVYYGAFFILYLKGIWIPSLTGIAIMFGFGNVFDSIVSWLAYRYYRKKMSE